MRFLLDMNISPSVAIELRRLGHDVVHLGEAGLATISDATVFAKAREEARVVVTFDLDFGEIVALSTRPGPGVALLRLRVVRLGSVIARLKDAIERAGPALEEGAIVIVEEERIRTRRFPVGEDG
jgi:predicted nuclease of predicted toxin-antitoxin system